MSYLFSDFTPEDRVSLLELEITRLQDLCRKNFATIDEMKKESRKLQEVRTELIETTTDLAYDLAEFPYWQSESLQSAVKVLASFTQKIQYILELPTFIDPIEQLEKNGGFNHNTITKLLKRRNVPDSSSGTSLCKYIRRCKKCKKKFRSLLNYEKHSQIHGRRSKRVKCRFCPETFQSFIAFKIHLKNIHSFPPIHHDHKSSYGGKQQQEINFVDDENKEGLPMALSMAETLKKNHVRVWRFFKCKLCDTVCSLNSSFKKHLKICRALQQQQQQQEQSSSSESSSKTEVSPNIHSENVRDKSSLHAINNKKYVSESLLTGSIASFQNNKSFVNTTNILSTPKIVTIHEDTSETETENQDQDEVLNLTKEIRMNLETFTKDDILLVSPLSVNENATETTAVAPELANCKVMIGNVTVDKGDDMDVSMEPMTVAGAPVRLCSINVNSSPSTSTSSATASLPSSQSSVLTPKDVNAASKCQQPKSILPIGNTSSDSPRQQQSFNLSNIATNTKNDSISANLPSSSAFTTTSTLSLPHSSLTNTKTSKLSPTMCYLPSSSSSWEEPEEEEQEHDPEQQQQPSTSGHNSNRNFSILNGNRGTVKLTCSHRNCSRSFATKSKLFHHEKTHTEIGEPKSFTCQLCSKEFKDKYRLKTHFFTHCSESYLQKPMYRCLECGAFHASLKELASHNEAEHSNSKMNQPRFHCDCGFYTNYRCKLDLHKKSRCRGSAGTSQNGRNNDGDNRNHRVGFTVFRDAGTAL